MNKYLSHLMIGLAVAALILTIIYAVQPARTMEIKALKVEFYGALPRAGISLDGRHTRNHLVAGKFTPWTHMTSRAMLTRWREREAAPFAVESLYSRWESGFWRLPTLGEWTETLEQVDREWLEQRAEYSEPWEISAADALDQNWTFTVYPADAAEQIPIVRDDESIEFTLTPDAPPTIQFLVKPAGLPTARIGDVLLVEWGEEGWEMPPTLYWSTTQLAISGRRMKVGETTEPDTSAYSFPAEPGWICHGAEAWTWRFDFAPKGGKIVLRGFRGEDSGRIY
ncbi:hypothetical protein KQI84_12215 [bacterium]|nr:hypothetical protein [bacterium]